MSGLVFVLSIVVVVLSGLAVIVALVIAIAALHPFLAKKGTPGPVSLEDASRLWARADEELRTDASGWDKARVTIGMLSRISTRELISDLTAFRTKAP